jgi:nudix-type nucleoside diphosphatase (YffH/AdpP family)
MPKKVVILDKKDVFKRAIFRVEEARFRHELYNGAMSEELVRLNFERGDSSAVLIHDRLADTVVFTEQFRFATYEKGPGWILELPAGTIEEDEEPLYTMRRELIEETGYHIETLEHISTFYLSPGGTSERIQLFYALATSDHRRGKGGGRIEEGEDIKIITMPLDDALAKIKSGEIADAKTILALYWLALKKRNLV